MFESLLNLTLFRAELSTENVVTLLALLAFFNFFHVVIETRVGMLEEHVDGFASISKWQHARMLILFVVLCLADGLMLSSLTHYLSEQGASYLLLFAAEYMLQFLDLARAGFRYLIAFQTARYGGAEAWPNRPLVLMSGKLIIDIARLVVSITYFCILSAHFGLPVLLVRNLLKAASDVRREATSLLAARRLRVLVRTSFAPPTVEHLRHDALCAVCHEDILETDAERETARRLACGHAFHINCLLSWWLRSVTCPTCRAEVDLNAPPIQERAAPPLVAAVPDAPPQAFVDVQAQGLGAAAAVPLPPVAVFPILQPVAAAQNDNPAPRDVVPQAAVAASRAAASSMPVAAPATLDVASGRTHTAVAAVVNADADGGWAPDTPMLPPMSSPSATLNRGGSSSGGGGLKLQGSDGGGLRLKSSGGGGSTLGGASASAGGESGSARGLSAEALREETRRLCAAAALARLNSPPPLVLPPPSPTATAQDTFPQEESSPRSTLRSSLRPGDAAPSPRRNATYADASSAPVLSSIFSRTPGAAESASTTQPPASVTGFESAAAVAATAAAVRSAANTSSNAACSRFGLTGTVDSVSNLSSSDDHNDDDDDAILNFNARSSAPYTSPLALARVAALNSASRSGAGGGSAGGWSRTRPRSVASSPALAEARAALAAALSQAAVLAELQHTATIQASAALAHIEAVAAAEERRASGSVRHGDGGSGSGGVMRRSSGRRRDRDRAREQMTPRTEGTRTEMLERALALEQEALEMQLRVTRELRQAEEARTQN
jgi:E3 ubiquitin-protein ligase synoviolin